MLQTRTQKDNRVKNGSSNLEFAITRIWTRITLDGCKSLTKLIQNSPTMMINVQIDFYVQ